jgi:hypothetical protein
VARGARGLISIQTCDTARHAFPKKNEKNGGIIYLAHETCCGIQFSVIIVVRYAVEVVGKYRRGFHPCGPTDGGGALQTIHIVDATTQHGAVARLFP